MRNPEDSALPVPDEDRMEEVYRAQGEAEEVRC
jgi:hypothetical protein